MTHEHHFIYPSPDGPTSIGKCKIDGCSAVSEANNIPDVDIETKGQARIFRYRITDTVEKLESNKRFLER